MRILAYDPFVAADRARQMGVELVTLDQAVAEADFLTVHLPKNKETTGLINRDLLLKAKPSLRVINVARGGIVVEQDLADAVRDGVIAGAALDVFVTEPTTSSPLFELDSVVVTPHLGASHARGAGQGRRHDRRHGPAGARRRVRAVRRQRQRRRGQRDAAPVPPAGRATRPAVRLAGARARRARGGRRGRHRRLRHADPRRSPRSRASSAPRATRRSPTSTPRSWPRDRGVEVRESSSASSPDFVNLVTLRGGGTAAVGHARRPAQRAAPGGDRRAPRRRAAEREHADGQERRPSGRHRSGRHHARQRRREHRRHGRRVGPRSAAPP